MSEFDLIEQDLANVLYKSRNLKTLIENDCLKKYEISNSIESLELSINRVAKAVISIWDLQVKVGIVLLIGFFIGLVCVLVLEYSFFITAVVFVIGIETLLFFKGTYEIRRDTYEAVSNLKEIKRLIRNS